ncbi:hypothetical protein CAEBREN_31311 [Caenorhabditis brenneri]|uniref:G-protein coupled receptors family 1 profile domain-containing protein n=1 Tax=Caenorhabditis brenneri TaxID=135651 RepID=G0NES2_CAEBE|nr:hypothetical protein CAEBREN_31311 [Caenorhabditis brenneri]
MALMNISAILLSIIGVLASIFSVVTNSYLLKKHRKKKDDMILFYCRFLIDVLTGIFEAIYLLFIISYATFNPVLTEYRHFLIYFGLPASGLGSSRSIVALVISMERFLAAYFPLFYHINQRYFSTISVLIVSLTLGSLEPFVLFGVCDYKFEIPQKCAALGCAINRCFFVYWINHRTANLLALIDAGTVFIFGFLPNITAGQLSKYSFFSFENIGPFGAVSKCLGCAIEAYLVYKTMLQKTTVVKRNVKK